MWFLLMKAIILMDFFKGSMSSMEAGNAAKKARVM